MKTINQYALRKLSFAGVTVTVLVASAGIIGAARVHAASTSNFFLDIAAGVLAADFVDTTSSFASVGAPDLDLGDYTYDYTCQTASTSTFGTATQAIYITNPFAAGVSWNLAIAADTGATAIWTDGTNDFDFNDGSGAPAGCADGGDTDAVGGQMTINPSTGTIATGACTSCTTTGVSAGASTAFDEGVTDSITIMSSASANTGDFYITGVSVDQTLPPEQDVGTNYQIDMTLTATGS